MKLAVADINGIDPDRAAGQQDVGKTTGRCAHIQTGQPLDRKSEVIQRLNQFESAAADPGMVRFQKFGHSPGGDHLPGLGNSGDLAVQDQGPGPRPAGREAEIDQPLVSPDPAHPSMVWGSQVMMAGNMTRPATVSTSATKNGPMPRNTSVSGMSGLTPLTT